MTIWPPVLLGVFQFVFGLFLSEDFYYAIEGGFRVVLLGSNTIQSIINKQTHYFSFSSVCLLSFISIYVI